MERVPDYWGKDLAVNRGRCNFDVLRYDYYRDVTVALEAFKAGAYDFRVEASAKDWATAYDIPAVKDGRIVKESIPNERPAGMQGFAFNMRRPLFQDRRVRQALGYAFDFEWSNQTLFYGQYTRTESYFDNSELAANGVPGPDELAMLEPFRGKVPDEVFTNEFEAADDRRLGQHARQPAPGRRAAEGRPAGRRRTAKLVNGRRAASASRSCSTRRSSSASRCRSRRTSSASASRPTCAPWTRRSTGAAPTTSTST